MEMFLASGKWKPSSPLRPTSHTWKLGSRLFQGKMWSWHQFRFSPVPKIVDRFTLNLEWDASNVWNAGLNWRSWAKVDEIRNSMWSTIEPHYATGSWAFKSMKILMIMLDGASKLRGNCSQRWTFAHCRSLLEEADWWLSFSTPDEGDSPKAH